MPLPNNNQFHDKKIKVKALFLDYDGTLAPLNVPRPQSMVSKDKLSILNQISNKIPVAVISTKDLAFLVKRTPFAHGWSGISGLEIKVGAGPAIIKCPKGQLLDLAKAFNNAMAVTSGIDGIIVEEKQDSAGIVVAFSVDWRQARDLSKAKEQAVKIRAFCESARLFVTQYEGQPFFDVFPFPVDKGKAFLEMKQRLGLNGGILYLGDSVADNSAFQKANIAVAVVSEKVPDSLVCNYFVSFDDLAIFLEDLCTHYFYFNDNLSKIYMKH